MRTANASVPTSDINGTLVGHGDGTYTYTFATDITKVAPGTPRFGALP